ncbi:hypothetical protein [Streptosporangium sp. NPDC051022]|uniref:hypothetical protein n=1 Tax=Streptosporangium sp. NPDC051022 TaxID=3155752 RepID=UPI00342F4471
MNTTEAEASDAHVTRPRRRTGAEAHRPYRARPGDFVLIRPDGHIALRAHDAQETNDHLAVVKAVAAV